jgi:hypothetical protein
MNPFTFDYIRGQYHAALDAGYDVLTCQQYVDRRAAGALAPLTLVNRVDVDFSIKKADRLRAIFGEMGIPASFFIRLHAKEYNPFDFENYRILKAIRDDGHELAYHSEIIDQSVIWDEDPSDCLQRDLAVMEAMLGVKVTGAASHGGTTGLNNLDFWRDRRADDYGLVYEGYETSGNFNLFDHSLYVTDSEWVRWKAYRGGQRLADDHRSLSDHVSERPPVIYLLVHPDTYFDRHVYE